MLPWGDRSVAGAHGYYISRLRREIIKLVFPKQKRPPGFPRRPQIMSSRISDIKSQI